MHGGRSDVHQGYHTSLLLAFESSTACKIGAHQIQKERIVYLMGDSRIHPSLVQNPEKPEFNSTGLAS